jgi:hypothetical protein
MWNLKLGRPFRLQENGFQKYLDFFQGLSFLRMAGLEIKKMWTFGLQFFERVAYFSEPR